MHTQRQEALTLFGKWQHNAVKSMDSGDRLPGFHLGPLLNLSVRQFPQL